MSQKERIYLSIPIKGCEDWSLRESNKAQLHYENLGFEVYNPNNLLAEYRKILQYEPSEFQKLTFTLSYLSRSDIMVLFPEYPRSFRCAIEKALAYKLKKPTIQVYGGKTLPLKSNYQDILESVCNPAEMFLFSSFKVN